MTSIKLTFYFGVLALVLTVSSGCSLFGHKRPILSSQGLLNAGVSGNTVGTVSIRDFSQVLDSVSVVTGVSVTDPALASYYSTARSRLSLDGGAESVSPSVLLAMTGIAGVACQRMIQAEQQMGSTNRSVYSAIDFSKDQTVLTTDVRTAIFNALGERFWRRAPTPNELAILSQAVDDTISGQSKSSQQLMNALLVTCTSMLSSLDFIQG